MGIQTMVVCELADQFCIPSTGLKTLTIDENMLLVVQHSCAPVQPHAMVQAVVPLHLGEPDLCRWFR